LARTRHDPDANGRVVRTSRERRAQRGAAGSRRSRAASRRDPRPCRSRLSFCRTHIALLPSALKPFWARYLQVQLHLIEGWYPMLEDGLKYGKRRLLCRPSERTALLLQEHLFENTRIVLGRRGHPLASARSLKDLVDAEWASGASYSAGRYRPATKRRSPPTCCILSPHLLCDRAQRKPRVSGAEYSEERPQTILPQLKPFFSGDYTTTRCEVRFAEEFD
jgi:hypothetical protein